jgi:hypothetical protein
MLQTQGYKSWPNNIPMMLLPKAAGFEAEYSCLQPTKLSGCGIRNFLGRRAYITDYPKDLKPMNI